MPINAYQPLDEVAWMSTFGMAIVGHGMHVISAAASEVPRARDTEFEEIVVETMETEWLAWKKTVLRRCFFWRSPYVAIYHVLVATACHCPMYFSKVWLHQWPRWISSSEGVSTHRVVGDSPLRLPHGQSGKWHGCSFKLKGSLVDSPLVSSVKAIKQPRFYDNEKGCASMFATIAPYYTYYTKSPLNQSITREPRPATGRLQVLPLEGAEERQDQARRQDHRGGLQPQGHYHQRVAPWRSSVGEMWGTWFKDI